MNGQLEILMQIARTLDELEIPYMVVGSVASSLYGFSCATAVVDIVADIQLHHVMPLYTALEEDFYVDDQAMRQAVSARRSFNAIHFDSLFKVDVYLPRGDDFSRQEIERRRPEKLFPDEQQTVNLATPEDTILAKLRWYQQGGKISERQLSDAAGIIKVQGARLDVNYLRAWADKLKLSDLLDKVLEMAQ